MEGDGRMPSPSSVMHMTELASTFSAQPISRSSGMRDSYALGWVTGGLFVALLAAVYSSLFAPVEAAWRTDPNYSHGYLIPLLCLMLGVRAFQRAGTPSAGDFRTGLVCLVPGGALALAATVLPWPLLTFLSLALVLMGAAVAVGGRSWAISFRASILFSFFMFQVPVKWTCFSALWLQDMVAHLSAGIVDQFLICWRTGTVLHFVGVSQSLNVGEECSGLRQLVSFIAFAVLVGLLLDRPGWHRAALVLLAIPVAVIANVCRVALMCGGACQFGTDWMNGWLHHAPAAFAIPVGFAMLVGVDYLLGQLAGGPVNQDRADSTDPRVAGPELSHDLAAPGQSPDGASPPLLNLRRTAVFLGLVLLCQVAIKQHLHAAGADSFPAPRAHLSALPFELGHGWHGFDRPELVPLRNKLPYRADDILLRDYRSREGGAIVQVYAVYSRNGDDRKHHPEICIREVTGAPEDLEARAKITLDSEQLRQVQRFVFRTGTVGRTTVYYWHYTFLAPADDDGFIRKLHRRLGQTPPSVTVQVSMNAAEPRDWERIEKSVLPAIDAALAACLLPATAAIDSARLPIALVRE